MNNVAKIGEYFDSVTTVLEKLSRESVNKLVELVLQAYENNNTIFIFGNGGSGATASHFCGDLVKGVSYGLDKRFRCMCLNDNIPVVMSIANDIAYEDIFVEQLKNFVNADDVVIGLSGSGNSANVVKALEYGKKAGAKTVAVCGYDGGKIKPLVDLAVHANINDMQVAEDAHVVVLHCVMRILCDRLKPAESV